MWTESSRRLVNSIRRRVYGSLSGENLLEYQRNQVRPRIYQWDESWLVCLIWLLLLHNVPEKYANAAATLYITSMSFWIGGQLRLRLYRSRDLGSLAYLPVSDADYFDWQWRRVLRVALVAAGIAAVEVVPYHVPTSMMSQTWFLAPAWTLLVTLALLSTALLVYLLCPNMPCRGLSLGMLLAAVSMVLLRLNIAEDAALQALPAGWILALMQQSASWGLHSDVVMQDGQAVANTYWVLPSLQQTLPLAVLCLSFFWLMGRARSSFFIKEMILMTPSDPTPGIPTGAIGPPLPPISPTDPDAAEKMRQRRIQRDEMLAPKVAQLFAAAAEREERVLEGGGWIELMVAQALSARERILVGFLLTRRPGWTAGYIKAICITLLGTLAWIPLKLGTSLLVGYPLLISLAAQYNNLLETVLNTGAVAVVLWAACHAAPVGGGVWLGFQPVSVGRQSCPMYAGFPIGYYESLVAVCKINCWRLLFWLPLLLMQVAVCAACFRIEAGSGVEFSCRLFLLVVTAQPALVAMNFLGGNSSLRQLITRLVCLLVIAGFELSLGAQVLMSQNAWSPLLWWTASSVGLAVVYGWLFNRGNVDLMHVDSPLSMMVG